MEEPRSTDSDKDIKNNPLPRLDYFVKWGVKAWMTSPQKTTAGHN
jgi:hypothetical protein